MGAFSLSPPGDMRRFEETTAFVAIIHAPSQAKTEENSEEGLFAFPRLMSCEVLREADVAFSEIP